MKVCVNYIDCVIIGFAVYFILTNLILCFKAMLVTSV